MKTSLVCLLLMAAVACATPRAREAEEKAAVDDTALRGEADQQSDERFGYFPTCPLLGPCNGFAGAFGCWFDACKLPEDFLYEYFVYGRYPCVCCAVASILQCYDDFGPVI